MRIATHSMSTQSTTSSLELGILGIGHHVLHTLILYIRDIVRTYAMYVHTNERVPMTGVAVVRSGAFSPAIWDIKRSNNA